jgi:hypothetical protein
MPTQKFVSVGDVENIVKIKEAEYKHTEQAVPAYEILDAIRDKSLPKTGGGE